MIMVDNQTHSWRNPKFIIKLVAVLIIGAVLIVALLRDRIVNPPQWQVSVVGQGKVSYQADIALVALGVQIDKASTAEKALNELNSKTDNIIAAVKKAGIAPEDIHTQGFAVYTHYDLIGDISQVTGYDASQQLLVKVRNIQANKDLITSVVNEATKAGANKIDGITFEVSNLEELKQQARLLAINDAKSKAGIIASAAGVKLKKVVGWWDNFVQLPAASQSYYADGKGGGVVSGSVPNGLQEIIVDINLNYQIK